MNEEAVPKNTKMATKFGVIVFNGKLFNRFMGENIRLIDSIINYANAEQIEGLLLFIDFEKAFDSIEWPFIEKNP